MQSSNTEWQKRNTKNKKELKYTIDGRTKKRAPIHAHRTACAKERRTKERKKSYTLTGWCMVMLQICSHVKIVRIACESLLLAPFIYYIGNFWHTMSGSNIGDVFDKLLQYQCMNAFNSSFSLSPNVNLISSARIFGNKEPRFP